MVPVPAVSIIVPVYRVERYLPQCLESILAQPFRDYELILVDDGSPDGSAEIMHAYASRHPGIVELHKENGGLSSARNAGLDVARGKFIAFVDSDDLVCDGFPEEPLKEARRTDADLLLFNYRKFEGDTVGPPYLSMKDETLDLSGDRLKWYFYHRWMPYVHGQEAWCRLYRRDIIEKHHLRFAPNKRIFAEDTLFSGEYLMHVGRLCALQKPYILYRQRQDSLMAAKKPDLFRRLTTLAIDFVLYCQKVGKYPLLKNILPVLCYDKLICKGIRLDEDPNSVRLAMEEFLENRTLRDMLFALRGFSPLALYTLHTGKGIRSQWRARAFASAWLSGKYDKAVSLVED